MNKQTTAPTKVFTSKLREYKQLIDADVADYAKQVQKSTLREYGAHSHIGVDAYLDVLKRGGKRIRGALAMLGYEMSGGTDREMILRVARVLEMVHAYILIMDDINDRSATRRGGPSAHVLLAQFHKRQHYADGSEHFGESIAINAALIGNHAAQEMLANIDAPEHVRLKALSILNRTMAVTGHGQINDIFNEVTGKVNVDQVDNVLEWKTAHYTFINPLHIGMVLAGADTQATDAITEYALHAGRAFQITDDILGTFGNEFESGKSPLDDIREGKRTLLTVYALQHAGKADKNFLIQMLGNQSLTQAEFLRCQEILAETGALEHASETAKRHIEAANAALDKHQGLWAEEGTQFLRGLAEALLNRTA